MSIVQTQIKSLKQRVKRFGDKEGHPFRGNQWTTSRAVTRVSTSRKDTEGFVSALQKALPKYGLHLQNPDMGDDSYHLVLTTSKVGASGARQIVKDHLENRGTPNYVLQIASVGWREHPDRVLERLRPALTRRGVRVTNTGTAKGGADPAWTITGAEPWWAKATLWGGHK